MEKKDYLSLQNKYSFLQDHEERYRQELLAFINEAFEKHGNDFEFKCDTHQSWKDKNNDKDAEFDAMNDLPTYLNIGIDDSYIHEIYPYRIRQTCTDYGYKSIEVDGWDWYDSEWVENLEAHCTIEDLKSIAYFISQVLFQENEME